MRKVDNILEIPAGYIQARLAGVCCVALTGRNFVDDIQVEIVCEIDHREADFGGIAVGSHRIEPGELYLSEVQRNAGLQFTVLSVLLHTVGHGAVVIKTLGDYAVAILVAWVVRTVCRTDSDFCKVRRSYARNRGTAINWGGVRNEAARCTETQQAGAQKLR